MATQVELLTGLVNVAIPEVYQKGMSYYEVLTAVVNKVNELIEQSNEYFSEDVKTVLESILVDWVDDGTLDDMISDAVLAIGDRVYTEQNYVTNAETLTTSVDKLDKAVKHNTDELETITDYMEIEPDTLRTSPTQTDGDLLQLAFDLCGGADRATRSIKLGRIYGIDKVVNVGSSISYQNNPHLIIKGYGGGLKLEHNGFMFDGNNNAGGLLFDNVKFVRGSEDHGLFNSDNLIQLQFNGCQFINLTTVIEGSAADYIQSLRIMNCNFKGMRDYQIKGAMIYDGVIHNNLIEWGSGGLIHLTQTSVNQYAAMNLVISSNVIEGISGQAPIKMTHCGRCSIKDNYFEGNDYTDIDLTDAVLPHRALAITDNMFGNFSGALGKTASVKPGLLYRTQGYNFSGNIGTKTIFDFTGIDVENVNLTGGRHLFNANANYTGIDSSDIFYSSTTKPLAGVSMTANGKKLSFSLTSSPENLKDKVYLFNLTFNRTGSDFYAARFVGYMVLTTGFDVSMQLELSVKPLFSYSGDAFSYSDTFPASLTFKFLSSGTERITIPSLLNNLSETIVVETTDSNLTSAREGYMLSLDEVVKNA